MSKSLDAIGVPLSVGDEVEARYKGKGSKRYPGKISGATPGMGGAPWTYDIAYNDGDSESGARGENIWRVGGVPPVDAAPPVAASAPSQPSAAVGGAPTPAPSLLEARGVDMSGKVLVVGDKVEAIFKGKGTKYYPGEVAGVTLGGEEGCTLSIRYNDGDFEASARPKFVRRVGASKGEESSPVAAVVEVVNGSDPAPPAEATSAAPAPASAPAPQPTSSSTASTSRPPTPTPTSTPAPAPTPALPPSTSEVPAKDTFGPRGKDLDGKVLVQGDKVEAKFKGKGSKYYPGVISGLAVGEDGVVSGFSILYNDGDKEDNARSEHIRRVGASKCEVEGSHDTTGSSGGGNGVGGEVSPAPSSTAAEVLPSTTTTTTASSSSSRPGSATTVPPSVVPATPSALPLDPSPSPPTATADTTAAPTAAAVVAAVTATASGSRPGSATTTPPQPITSPATAVEVTTPVEPPALSLPAPTPAPPVAVGDTFGPRGKDLDGKVLVQGDKVEAKFKGKGSKYYPGAVSMVTVGEEGVRYSILYDDGDKEDNARPEHVRRVGASKCEAVSSDAAVAAATPATPAVVEAVVPSPPPPAATPAPSSSTSRPGSATIAPAPAPAPAPATAPGDAIPAAATATPSVLEAPPSVAAPASTGPTPSAPAPVEDTLGPRGKDLDGKVLVKGDKVEAKFKGKGSKYYPGAISMVTVGEEGVRYSILYDDGDKEDNARPEHVRRTSARSICEVDTPSLPTPASTPTPSTTAANTAAPSASAVASALIEAAAVAAVTSADAPISAPSTALTAVPASVVTPLASRPSTPLSQPILPSPTTTPSNPTPAAAAAAAPAASLPPTTSSVTPAAPSLAAAATTTTNAAASAPSFRAPTPPSSSVPPFTPTTSSSTSVPASYPTPSPYHHHPPPVYPSPAQPPLTTSFLGSAPHAPPPPAQSSYSSVGGAASVGPSHYLHVAPPLAALGRLARELAAVRQRARPALFDAYTALSKARVLSSGGLGASGISAHALTPSVGDVMGWVMQSLVRAQALVNVSGGGGGGGMNTTTTNTTNTSSPLINTVALRDGLRSVGFNAGKEALAVLRSAFRVRELQPHSMNASSDSAAQHAAIRAEPLVAYLCLEEHAAAPLLERVDEETRSRTHHTRPPRAPSGAVLSGEFGSGGSSSSSSSSAGVQRSAGSSMMGGGQGGLGMMASSLVSGAYTIHGSTPSPAFGGGGALPPSGGHSTSFSAPSSSSPATGAAISPTVGDWIRRCATQGERENLVAFMGVVAEFQARNSLTSNSPAGVATLATTGDSLVIPLGPHLKVGLRVYV